MNATVRGVAKSHTQLSDFHFSLLPNAASPFMGELPAEQPASTTSFLSFLSSDHTIILSQFHIFLEIILFPFRLSCLVVISLVSQSLLK